MEWKDINGFEGKYQISEDGRVRSIGRVVKNKCGTMTVNERILKPWIDTWGYKNVCLCNDGKCQSKKVHRLIAEAFVPPYSGEQVNHIDGDKLNNSIENLEWCTNNYNINYGTARKRQADKIRGIPHKEEHKKKIASSLLKYYETHDSASIGRISEKRKGVVGVRNGESVQFQSVKDAAIAVNGSRANITRSCNSRTKKAYGYKWTWAGERKEGAD